jgi:S1-C subfamily serine protease
MRGLWADLCLWSALTFLAQIAYAANWGQIAARDNRATVLITAEWKEGEEDKIGYATGFVMDGDNHILTVAHLFPTSASGEVFITGRTEKWSTEYPQQEFTLKLVMLERNETEDFAVLVPEDSTPILQPAPLAFEWTAVEDEVIHVRGFPLGGRLIGLRGEIGVNDMSNRVQTSALLRAGYSGAPVYTDSGSVIGMVRGGVPVARDRKDPTIMGVGFFAPHSLI